MSLSSTHRSTPAQAIMTPLSVQRLGGGQMSRMLLRSAGMVCVDMCVSVLLYDLFVSAHSLLGEVYIARR